MSGLLIRELKLRGLIERVLIVCPANLAFQWQRELRDKFDEQFEVLKGGDIREQYGINQWLERPQIVTSQLASYLRGLKIKMTKRRAAVTWRLEVFWEVSKSKEDGWMTPH